MSSSQEDHLRKIQQFENVEKQQQEQEEKERQKLMFAKKMAKFQANERKDQTAGKCHIFCSSMSGTAPHFLIIDNRWAEHGHVQGENVCRNCRRNRRLQKGSQFEKSRL